MKGYAVHGDVIAKDDTIVVTACDRLKVGIGNAALYTKSIKTDLDLCKNLVCGLLAVIVSCGGRGDNINVVQTEDKNT